jgi:hypothetical protein
MNKKVALIVIYTHRYDKNIPIVEKIYKDRFSHIFHLVPFYNGGKSNVIPVYEHAHRFQGYITQGLNHFYDKDFQHYFFINDDLILNPVINEDNYQEHLRLGPDDSFFPEFISLHELKPGQVWKRVKDGYEYRTKQFGCEFINELPSYEEALASFKKVGLTIEPLTFDQIYHNEKLSISALPKKGYIRKQIRQIKHKNTEFHLKYPLVGGYSDTLVVSGSVIKKFAHYSGIFAASCLFHELALTTALVLSTPNIKLEKDLKLQGKAFWTDEELKTELAPFGNSMTKLLENFPPGYLYLHPIKLSQWKSDSAPVAEKVG